MLWAFFALSLGAFVRFSLMGKVDSTAVLSSFWLIRLLETLTYGRLFERF